MFLITLFIGNSIDANSSAKATSAIEHLDKLVTRSQASPIAVFGYLAKFLPEVLFNVKDLKNAIVLINGFLQVGMYKNYGIY